MVPFAPVTEKGMFDYATGKWAPASFKNYVTGEWTTERALGRRHHSRGHAGTRCWGAATCRSRAKAGASRSRRTAAPIPR